MGLTMAGLAALTWWLVALSSGPAYDYFTSWATSWLGVLIGVGLTWAFFQHLLSGIRHLVMDVGAGLELRTNKRSALLTLVGGALLTGVFWGYMLLIK